MKHTHKAPSPKPAAPHKATATPSTIPQHPDARRESARAAKCQASEDAARALLDDLFGRVFDKSVVLTNMIFPTGETSAVRSAEIDAVVVCNAGVFLFEVKSWTNCKVLREKSADGVSEWTLNYKHGHDPRHPVKDPVHQLGGKLKVISPFVKDAVCKHIEYHAIESSLGLDALADDGLGHRLSQSVNAMVAQIKNPNIRMRSYVLLPMDGVDLPLNVPSNVILGSELPLVLRQLYSEVKRDKTPRVPFTDAMVETIAAHLKEHGSKITRREHLENVHAVYGGCEAALAVIDEKKA